MEAECIWLRRYYDSVPVPFGVGNCSMETLECVNEDVSDEDIDACSAGTRCKCFKPVPEADFEERANQYDLSAPGQELEVDKEKK